VPLHGEIVQLNVCVDDHMAICRHGVPFGLIADEWLRGDGYPIFHLAPIKARGLIIARPAERMEFIAIAENRGEAKCVSDALLGL
jgi:hypothetical protein